LVFQYERPNAISLVAKRLAADESISDNELRELLNQKDDSIMPEDDTFLVPHFEEGDEDSEGVSRTTSVSAQKAFTKYQAATSALWNQLSEKESAQYHADAEMYRTQGAPMETRRK
jgi:hypothetical protein